jgi:PII-like signaling protein
MAAEDALMMTRTQGEYLRFYVHENRRHHGILLYQWLLEQAQTLGIHGGTAFRSVASFGRHGVLHEQHFFELAGDVTIRVDFVVTAQEARRMLALLDQEELSLFYAEMPAEFGLVGGAVTADHRV